MSDFVAEPNQTVIDVHSSTQPSSSLFCFSSSSGRYTSSAGEGTTTFVGPFFYNGVDVSVPHQVMRDDGS